MAVLHHVLTRHHIEEEAHEDSTYIPFTTCSWLWYIKPGRCQFAVLVNVSQQPVLGTHVLIVLQCPYEVRAVQ